MKNNDKEMNRGLNQVLYKYLPDSWIDFYIKSMRTSLTAKVTHWNSTNLEDINQNRILQAVKNSIDSFESSGGNVKGFGAEINSNTYSIMTPKSGINAGIKAEVSPLVFFCSNANCKKVYSFQSSQQFLSNIKNIRCKECGSTLRQLNFTYACKCGWAEPIKVKPCKEHRFKYIKLGKKDYNFICSKCGRTIEMFSKCKECNSPEIIYPKNALDFSRYIPASLTLIDLVDKKKEELLSYENIGSKIIMAYYLDKINNNEFEKIIKNGVNIEEDELTSEKLEKEIEYFVSLGIPREYAVDAAKENLKRNSNNNINQYIDYINLKLNNLNDEVLMKKATEILEYDSILKANIVTTLDEASQISMLLNNNSKASEYIEVAKKFGFKNVQVSGEVPFVFLSYGYTRIDTQPDKKVCLRAFPQENDKKKNIYGTKLVTEGVLFEFDRKKIIQWLISNNFVDELMTPNDLDNEEELKIWFLNNINTDSISTFSNIDRNIPTNEITSYVYTLIHSVSHALIKEASQLCGLDKNSISEYIFPSIPAIFIYCHNSQGFNLGALFNLFEAYFDKWLSAALEDIRKCIFDPVCIDRDKACAGCILLNEVSCCHFNKDLDRSYLIGAFDKINRKKTIGYWNK